MNTEMIELKRKTKDIVLEHGDVLFSKDFLENPEHYFSRSYDIKSVSLFIHIDFSDEKGRVLVAQIQWCYSASTAVTKDFPCTYEGFLNACEWLDGQRIEFIKQLL